MCIQEYVSSKDSGHAHLARDPQFTLKCRALGGTPPAGLFASYFVGLITVTSPPKFRSLFEDRPARIAAAIAPPAASNKAASAPPPMPGMPGRARRVQRVPG